MIERYTRPEMGKIWSEKNKFHQWLRVEIAALKAQEDLGLIPVMTPGITSGISEAKDPIAFACLLSRIQEIEKVTQHDLKAFVEACQQWLPKEAKPYFHRGLTSYDIEDTALALIMQKSIKLLQEDVRKLNMVLRDRALEHRNTPMIGRTHGMHAEPITFGVKLLNWVDEMERHQQRLVCLPSSVCVGKISGVVGICTLPPEVEKLVCRELKLWPAKISTQIVSRDRHAEYVFTLALIAGSLDKFATEIRNLQRPEIGEVEESFVEGQVGSSAMPHKRNPTKSENISALARLFHGWVVTALENQNTWHERDLANSANERITLPDSSIALDFMLDRFTKITEGLVVYPEKMRENLERGGSLIYSQNVIGALASKGMPREQAYGLVQGLALHANRTHHNNFKGLVLVNEEVKKILSAGEILACFDLKENLKYIDEIFARFGLEKKEEQNV